MRSNIRVITAFTHGKYDRLMPNWSASVTINSSNFFVIFAVVLLILIKWKSQTQSKTRMDRKSSRNLVIMSLNKRYQYYVGFGSYEPNEKRFSWPRIAFIFSLMLSSFVTSGVSIIINYNDINYVVEVVFSFCIYVIMMCSYSRCILNRDVVQNLMTDIQDFVNERKNTLHFICFNLFSRFSYRFF